MQIYSLDDTSLHCFKMHQASEAAPTEVNKKNPRFPNEEELTL